MSDLEQQNKRRYDLPMRLPGSQPVRWHGQGFATGEFDTTRQWLRSGENSVEGGTPKAQPNVIAKHVHGLRD